MGPDMWLRCFEADHHESGIMATLRRLDRTAAKRGERVVRYALHHGDEQCAITDKGSVII